MSTHANPGDPRGSKRALIPLWLMAIAFFLPSYKGCSDESFQSAAHFVGGDWQAALWVVPVFALAAIFGGLTVLALRRGVPDRLLRRVGLGALGTLAVGSVATAGFISLSESSIEPGWLLGAAAAAASAVWLVRSAKGRAPWQMWERLLAGFAVVAAATFPSVYLGASVLEGLPFEAYGAWLFVGAQVALWLVLGVALVQSRRRPA